jgi:uncharacterized protein
MEYTEGYIEQLRRRLSELDPHLILLFGSHAYGIPDKDSDIDLIVVTKDNFIPVDFNARVNLQLRISEHIFDISKKVPVDLIVYTLPMYKKLLEQNSGFANDVKTKGKVLYESSGKTVA